MLFDSIFQPVSKTSIVARLKMPQKKRLRYSRERASQARCTGLAFYNCNAWLPAQSAKAYWIAHSLTRFALFSFGSREARACCSGWGRKSESATDRPDTTRPGRHPSLFLSKLTIFDENSWNCSTLLIRKLTIFDENWGNWGALLFWKLTIFDENWSTLGKLRRTSYLKIHNFVSILWLRTRPDAPGRVRCGASGFRNGAKASHRRLRVVRWCKGTHRGSRGGTKARALSDFVRPDASIWCVRTRPDASFRNRLCCFPTFSALMPFSITTLSW